MGDPVVLAAGFVTGVLGFVMGAFLRRKQYIPDAFPAAPLLPGHEHDLHIGGKRNGRVRLRCMAPGCRFEKYRDE